MGRDCRPLTHWLHNNLIVAKINGNRYINLRVRIRVSIVERRRNMVSTFSLCLANILICQLKNGTDKQI